MSKSMKTILVIDNNSEDRESLIGLLEDDYNILEAQNKTDALELINAKVDDIAAVILNIADDEDDGYDILYTMKKKKYLSGTPVIVTSDDADEECELKVLSLGASDFLRKPYNPVIIQKRLNNVMELQEQASMVHYLQKDHLTGVYSHEVFCKKVSEILKNDRDTEYAIVYSDMENFKLLKDLFGENTGDSILVYMAKVFKHFVAKDELCGRMEADHFVLFIRYHKDTIKENLESIVKVINDFPVNMTIRLRFGIYKVDDRSMSVHAMCNRAIFAVDTIKGRYGQYVAFYDEKIYEQQLHEQETLNYMEEAISQKQFKVYFQPKYDLNAEHVAGAEALVRWVHPKKGFMNPAEFIPLFEKNGFITELDKYVWDMTCSYIEKWEKLGYPTVPISVNVSRTDIYNPDFIDIIMEIINKHHLKPENIHLEITETAYTDNPRQIINVVKELKLKGFVIEMDDFGSGYSSLNMLNELPIDILKLDMGFVQGNLKMNSNNILSFVIGLAKWMDYAVVAEGVETEEQIQMLRNMDCNYVQGYYYAQPMPPDEFEAYMLKHNVLDGNDHNYTYALEEFRFKKSKGVMLIIDDISLNRKILSSAFSDYFEIVEKENGAAAYEYIKENADKIDVIMLDLVMPVMDGFSLMKQLRSDGKYDHIPIIVTSQGGEKSVEKSFALGATDFVEKPYNIRIILHRVQNVIMAYKKSR